MPLARDTRGDKESRSNLSAGRTHGSLCTLFTLFPICNALYSVGLQLGIFCIQRWEVKVFDKYVYSMQTTGYSIGKTEIENLNTTQHVTARRGCGILGCSAAEQGRTFTPRHELTFGNLRLPWWLLVLISTSDILSQMQYLYCTST